MVLGDSEAYFVLKNLSFSHSSFPFSAVAGKAAIRSWLLKLSAFIPTDASSAWTHLIGQYRSHGRPFMHVVHRVRDQIVIYSQISIYSKRINRDGP